jgi:putative ABC transport system permease protein
MLGIVSDIRYSLRGMSRSRTYTAVAVLTLAVSMGAATAIFSMADAIVNRPFDFPELHRLMSLSTTLPKADASQYLVSTADFLDWGRHARAFSGLTTWQHWDARLTGHGDPKPVRAALVSPNFFHVIGAQPLAGVPLGDENEAHEVVISYSFWQQQMKASGSAVGSNVELDGNAYTVAAVMPERFSYPDLADIWAPWIPLTGEEKAQRAAPALHVIGRLAPGVSMGQASAEMNQIARELAREYPSTNAGRGVNVMPLAASIDPYAGRYVAIVAMAVAFLLILACANVANIQLLRGAVRDREIAVRSALGATPIRIARQQLTEGVLLAMAGVLLGLPLAFAILRAIKASIPSLVMRHLPGLPHAGLDRNMLLCSVGAAVLTGIAFTLPAVQQAFTGRLQERLREGGRGTVNRRGQGMRSALVVGEVALALILVAGGLSLLETVRGLDPGTQGFHPENVFTFHLNVPAFQYPGDVEVTSLYREILRQLESLPALRSAALISDLPALSDSRSTALEMEDRPAAPADRPVLAEFRIASPDYFKTVGIPLSAGRSFEASDTDLSEPVALLSRAAADRYWPQGNAIGQRVRFASGEKKTAWHRVIGIVGDVHQFFLDTDIRPTVYVSYLQNPQRSMNVVVQPLAVTEQTAAAVREAVARADSKQTVYALQSLNSYFVDLAGGVGVIAKLIGVFALLSLMLSATGIYAVMHYTVTQRTPEIGIRLALGASASTVRSMILGNALRLAGWGLGIALPLTWVIGRMMNNLLAGITGIGVLTLAGTAVLIAASTLLAAYLPARRAMRIDPLIAIRSE